MLPPQHLHIPSTSSNPYFFDQLRLMRLQESTTYRISRDFLGDPRKQMLSWAFQVVDSCKIDRQVAISAITYLDRFLAGCDCQSLEDVLSSKQDFQTCFVACLLIAIKNCAGMNVKMQSVSELFCPSGMYDEDKISRMEIKVLRGLSWKLNGPTAMDFVHAFLQMLPAQSACTIDLLTAAAKAQVENAMLDSRLALQEPSSIAYSSILFAIGCLDSKNYGRPVVHPYNRLEWMQSISIIASINTEDASIRYTRSILVENSSKAHVIYDCEPTAGDYLALLANL